MITSFYVLSCRQAAKLITGQVVQDAHYYVTLTYVKKARDSAVSTGRPLDRGRVDNGSENDVRDGVWIRAEAARGGVGTVYKPVCLSLRPPHGPQTCQSSDLLEEIF